MRAPRSIRIAFVGAMVRAIARDQKCETRRMGDGPEIAPGDTLLVCEAAWYWCDVVVDPKRLTPAGRPKRRFVPVASVVVYCADGAARPTQPYDNVPGRVWRWKPPRFMPAWAIRHRLRVNAVHRECIHGLTEGGALREGILVGPEGIGYQTGLGPEVYPTAREAFAVAWDQLHGAGSWHANPRVRVIAFRRVRP